MDYADGKPLNSFVYPENLLPVSEVYRIVCDVDSAFEYAHENNIVHRDIKPGNIIYNPSPYQVKVTDFGIARLIDNSKTSTGEILGSPLYMAPEQLKGKKVNRSADVCKRPLNPIILITV
jgi:serine/threonine protein kinase